jgi:hypothetical protein
VIIEKQTLTPVPRVIHAYGKLVQELAHMDLPFDIEPRYGRTLRVAVERRPNAIRNSVTRKLKQMCRPRTTIEGFPIVDGQAGQVLAIDSSGQAAWINNPVSEW